MLKPLTITDHSGRDVPLWQGLTRGDMQHLLGNEEYREFCSLRQSEMLDEFSEAMGPSRHQFFGFRLSTYTLVIFLFIIAAALYGQYLVWWLRWSLIATGGALIGAFAGWAFGRRLRKLGPQTRYVRHMLARLRCPACLYDLYAVTPNGTEHIVCPECGGAWLVRSVQSPKS